jgi:predicted nucleic acid-binding protein
VRQITPDKEIKDGISLSLTDTLVGAIAKADNAIIVTANIRHYPMKDIR